MKAILLSVVSLFFICGGAAMAEEVLESELKSVESLMTMELEGLGNLVEQAGELSPMGYRSGHPRRRRPRRPPRHRRPRRPRHPVPPPHRRAPIYDYICYAENYRGHSFNARGRWPDWTQDRAMDECYRYSRRCYEMGCRRRVY